MCDRLVLVIGTWQAAQAANSNLSVARTYLQDAELSSAAGTPTDTESDYYEDMVLPAELQNLDANAQAGHIAWPRRGGAALAGSRLAKYVGSPSGKAKAPKAARVR